jgi:hypothetical protein
MSDDFYGLIKSNNCIPTHENNNSSEQINIPSITNFFKPVYDPQKTYFSTLKLSKFMSKKNFLKKGKKYRNKTSSRLNKSDANISTNKISGDIKINRPLKLEVSTGKVVSSPSANRRATEHVSSDIMPISRSFFPVLSSTTRNDWCYPVSLDCLDKEFFFLIF